MRNYWRH